MAAEFFPMDSLVTQDAETGVLSFDRAINSEIYRGFWSNLVKTGIQSDTEGTHEYLKVEAANGMYVTVNPGFAMIEGLMFRETELRTLSIQASDDQDRIDTVILRSDTSSAVRNCDLYVLKGTPASSPVRPALTRGTSIYEIGLADIFIPANSSQISTDRITDTRYDTTRSGTVRVVADLDMDSAFSTTSLNGLQNRVITNEFNRVKSNLNVKVRSFNSTTGALYLESVSL